MKKVLLVSLILISLAPGVVHASFVTKLLGKILLQVESHGEAWYVNPTDSKRYFLGRPEDAFNIMRKLGLGVSDKDFNNFAGYAPKALSGRIILKVEDLGQAYYVDPESLQVHYLGKPEDAFNIMRKLGLGITNNNLLEIVAEFNNNIIKSGNVNQKDNNINNFDISFPNNTTNNNIVPNNTNNTVSSSTIRSFIWNYNGEEYRIDLNLSDSMYKDYQTSEKLYHYTGKLPNDWLEQYYNIFLTLKPEDNSINKIINQLNKLAVKHNLTNNQLAELTVSFVQSIPYDQNKNLDNDQLSYPYELLYKQSGVCSEKTFLAVILLRELGYGTAVLDYADVNHAAAGIACPSKYDVHDSGYCYVETTNIFPIGVTPQAIDDTVATNIDFTVFEGQFDTIFNIKHMGNVEILQKTNGKIYTGIENTHKLVDKIRLLEDTIVKDKEILSDLKIKLDKKLKIVKTISSKMDIYQANANYSKYNEMIPEYNVSVNKYNFDLNNYKMKIKLYNSNIVDYNNYVNNFYQ